MNILSFSGFIPEQVCDTVRFIRYEGERRISHYCGYAADFISRVLDDPAVDGGVFPKTCDSSRAMAGYLDGCGKFVYQLHVPSRRDGAAADMLGAGIAAYKDAVERHFGVAITDMPERAVLVNERNRQLAGLYGELEDISCGAYLEMIHGLLQRPLRSQKVEEGGHLAAPPGSRDGKRVFLVGSLLCGVETAYAIEKAGMKVVGDRLTESKRLFSAPEVEPSGDICRNIAVGMLKNRVSPTQNDFRRILEEDLEEIRRKQVRGVIFVTQKYCEPYDYLFYVYKKMLDGMGIPVLQLKSADSTDTRRADAAVEAFADML